ncbi:MAG: Ig-like domain-containing protein [Saprospiraceae bacterium]|nr:Ig-like domain-containing protein [Saprospiraceae bacterium]
MERILVAAILSFLLCNCATRGRIDGGPRDETPPILFAAESTENEQTNFTKQTIRLTFDEWIQLKDPINQILVSPPLEKRFKTRIKGKSVLFEFDEEEVLRENATYSINFGEAIQDLNESNPVQNFTFVFSTGDVIDSLEVGGSVMDALTGEPLEGMTIMLYEEHQDSVIVKEKPFYASRTIKDGSFRISNVKEGTFRVVGIDDQNLDYRWTAGSETIAFPDSLVTVSSEQAVSLNLVASQPLAMLQRDRTDTTSWNIAVLPFNRDPSSVEIQSSLVEDTWTYVVERNTIWLYYPESAGRFQVYLDDAESDYVDTLTLQANPRRPKEELSKKSRWKNTFHPEDPVKICFDRPLSEFDSSRIQVMQGNKRVRPAIRIDDSLSFCLEFTSEWMADSTYRLALFPEAIRGIAGLTNDTILERFPIAGPDRFGQIDFTFSGLNPAYDYLVELLKDKTRLEFAFTLKGVEEVARTIGKLKPGKYTLRMVEDANGNGHWDPADYFAGKQAEALQEVELEELRANWDLEVDHKWK